MLRLYRVQLIAFLTFHLLDIPAYAPMIRMCVFAHLEHV